MDKRLRDGTTIDYELQNVIKKESAKWYCIHKAVVDGVLFCSKSNVAFRGVSNKIGDPNFDILLYLIEVISHDDPFLSDNVKQIKGSKQPATISYFSYKIQNEIICIMGQLVRQTIIEQIKKQNTIHFFFIVPLTSLTKNKWPKSSCIFIFQMEKWSKNHFIDFVCTNEKSRLGLSDKILKTIKGNGL